MRLARTVVLAVASVIALAACSAEASDEGSPSVILIASSVEEAHSLAQEHKLDWEASILADGTITAVEIEDAHDRFIQCQKNFGMDMKYDKWLDPVDGVTWRSVVTLEDAEVSDDLTEDFSATCERPYYLIQDTYATVTPHLMNPDLLVLFQKCLTENGVEFTGTERNIAEFIGDSNWDSAIKGPLGECVDIAIEELDPNMINLGGQTSLFGKGPQNT